MNKPRARLVAVNDKQGNELVLPPIQLRIPQLSERQIRSTHIPKFGPRTGTHPCATYRPHDDLINGLRHFGNYVAALFGAADDAPTAYNSRIDCALTHLEMH